MMTDKATLLAKLREPFHEKHIGKLPKEMKWQREAREKDRAQGVKCKLCGGWHHKDAVHLDYVGHAALTSRLLDTDIEWSWEPLSFDDRGLPAFDKIGGLWIKLTVCGVTRLGYGSADGKTGGDAVKEVIGDALRNAAMRFGAALDLWSKEDLRAAGDGEPEENAADQTPATITEAQLTKLTTMLEQSGADVKAFNKHFKVKSVKELPANLFDKASAMLERKMKEKATADKVDSRKPEPVDDLDEDEIPY